MLYAVLDAGRIVDYRPIPDWDNYPKHKKDARDERGDNGPTLRPVVEEGAGEDQFVTIALDHVKITRTPRPQRVRPDPEPNPHEARISALEAKVAALLEAIQTAGAR